MSQNKDLSKKMKETYVNIPKIEDLSIKEEGEELKKKKKKQLESEEDSPALDPDDDEEEDEDDEKNEYEFDDFVVDDNEASVASASDAGEGAPTEKKKKKRRKSEKLELSEEDIELIEEGNQKRQHKRIKKIASIEDEDKIEEEEEEEGKKIEEEEEEEDDFIEGGREKFAEYEKNREVNFLNQFFFQKEEEEDVGEVPREKNIQDVIEPEELEEEYESKEDKIIMNVDIPERFQLRDRQFKSTSGPDDLENEAKKFGVNDLVPESIWILTKLEKLKNSPLYENYQKKILKALELMKIQHYEVMYLSLYKKNEFLPDLQQNDLWDIYELDEEWREFSKLKDQIIKNMGILEESVSNCDLRINRNIVDLLQKTVEIDVLEYIHDYINYQLSKLDSNYESLEQETDATSFKRPSKRIFAKEAVQHKLDRFANQAAISVDQLCDNLQMDGRIHNPSLVEIRPEHVAEDYIDYSNAMYSKSLTVLETLCNYMAQEMFYHPSLRIFVRKLYVQDVTISTEPTIKGKSIDVTSPNFIVKRINKRPISEFTDDLWLLIESCEKDGLIKVKFCLPWNDDNNEFSDQRDEIYKKLGKNYIALPSPEMTEVQKKNVNDWNIIRTEVLKIYLCKMLYPYLQSSIRKELFDRAEKFVLKKCSEKFNKMLNVAPYRKQESQAASVLSVIIDQSNPSSIIMAYVDPFGEMIESKTFNFFGMGSAQMDEKQIKTPYEKDKEEFANLQNFIVKCKPDLFVIGANCLEARKLKIIINGLKLERSWACYGDSTVPQLFAKTAKAKKEFKDFSPIVREAISLARLMQNPMAEILNLWHEKNWKNATFYIPLHHLQDKVRIQNLKKKLEKIAIEMVNSVGVDFNEMIKHKHLANQLQFVSGLGPRKATYLLKTIRNSPNFNQGGLRFRKELQIFKILDQTVFHNCCGFLKVKIDEGDAFFEFDNNTGSLSNKFELLDTTRIHTENYVLARKIAKDALEDEALDADCIARIMKESFQLKQLDLEDYANHLSATKNKPNMIHVLNFIVNELTLPFADPRKGKTEMENEELFYRMCKDSCLRFKQNCFVNVKILKNEKNQRLVCKILENDLVGDISMYDAFDQPESTENFQKAFPEGKIIRAKVKHINYDKSYTDKNEKNFNVDLTIKPSEMKLNKFSLKEMFPNWNLMEKYFKLVEEEDFPHFAENNPSQKQARFIPRKINHPKFKNISMNAAMEFLNDRSVGDFIIRPSSKGIDHLNITWKFYDRNIVHLDLKEGPKLPGSQIASKYYISKDQFDSLDEVIEKYINSCNQIMKGVVQHKKFMKGELDIIESYMLEDKKRDNKRIPYYIGCFESAPQYIVLCYMLSRNEVVKEYIKIKPNGLFFHNEYFQGLKTLIPWFKENFRTSEYQRYAKKVKPPYSEPEPVRQELLQSSIMANQNIWPDSPGPSDNIGVPRIKEERIKDERIKREAINKSGMICNTCMRMGHTANQCLERPRNNNNFMPNKYDNNRNAGFDKRRDFKDKNERGYRKDFDDRNKGSTYKGKDNRCYFCKGEGHLARDCPQKNSLNEGQSHRSHDFQRRGNNNQRSRSRSKERNPRNNRSQNKNEWKNNSSSDWQKPSGQEGWNIGVDQKKNSTDWNDSGY